MARITENSNRVSVIIVCHNGMGHIDGCIPSVLAQGYKDKEIIFVDNASCDGSLEYVKRNYPTVTVVSNDRNLGYAGGLNSGLKKASGRYIAPLNVDTEVAPDWLSCMMASMTTVAARVGAVTPRIILYDKRAEVNTLGLNIHISGLGFCRGLGSANHHNHYGMEPVSGISGCSYLIPRDVVNRMGGFPEWTFMGNDDVVVSWLLRLMGYEIYCIHKAVVYHKYTLTMNPEKLYYLERGREVLLMTTLKPWTMIIISPILCATEAMVFAYSLLKGKGYVAAKLRAWAYLWGERGKIRARRRQYQSLRQVSDWTLLRSLRWNLNWKQLLGIV